MSTAADDKGSALLILVGQRETEESAVLSPTTECEFRLSLKYIILKSGQDLQCLLMMCTNMYGLVNEIGNIQIDHVTKTLLLQSASASDWHLGFQAF